MSIKAVLMMLFAFAALVPTTSGQAMLSEPPESILRYVKANYPGMVQDVGFRNEHYRYLKFTDSKNDSRTILFFLSDRDKCTAIRFIYEKGAKDDVVADLNSKYKYSGDSRWYFEENRKRATIELSDEEWFITVTIKPAEKAN
ncbi:MAG: hypothetical protein LC649_00230 [Bacteroidales bacterium]|nr:hypothetical protein [Bacteroidales bacterium]